MTTTLSTPQNPWVIKQNMTGPMKMPWLAAAGEQIVD